MPLTNMNIGVQGDSPYGVGSYTPGKTYQEPVYQIGPGYQPPSGPGLHGLAGQPGVSTGVYTYDPNNPQISLNSAGSSGTTTNDANSGSDAGTSSGFDWGQILNGLGNVLGSPLVSAGTMIGLGESAASSAQKDTAKLTSQLTTPAQPFVQGGVTELQQAQQGLTGAPVQGGSIGQQEQVAQQFGDIAKQYSTGQLTTAQQQQVQQQTAAQKQNIRQQLASQGMTDSSVLAMYDQQIDNNAVQMTQQLTQQNIGIAAQAQAAVQQTYSNLINDSIAQFGAGMGPIEDAVNLTVQQNTQIAQGLQSLFGQIARGFMGATAGGQSPTAGIGKGIGQIGNQLGKLFGNTDTSGITGDINNSIGAYDSSLFSDLNASTAAQEANVASDVASSNMDWLNSGGSSDLTDLAGSFSSAGGQAADALTPSVLGEFSFAPDLAGVGTGAVAPAVDAAAADATSALSSSGGAAGGVAGGASAGLGGLSGAQWGGAVAAPFALYNEINSWQSGATGQDALSGASTGAAIGTAIMPGIGTAIGAVGGAIAGAVSSLFGGGKVDPENANFEQYTQAFNKAPANMKSQVAASVTNPYVALAGYFDLRSGQLKGQNPIYQAYGRMGEQHFTNDLISKVQQAKSSGQTNPTQIWTNTVQPWLDSMGTWQDSNKDAMTALIQNMTGQIAAGTYSQNFKAIGGDEPFSGTPAGTSGTVGQYRARERYGLGKAV